MRLKEIAQLNGPTLLVPVPTGAQGSDREMVTMRIRRDIMAELRKTRNYGELVNLILAKHLQV